MTTYTYIHSFMTLSQRFDPNHDTCVTRLVWRRRVPWGLVVLAREYPCGPEVTAAAAREVPDIRTMCAQWMTRGASSGGLLQYPVTWSLGIDD